MKTIEQFDIYLADFGERLGFEQNGIRPCVVLQTNAVSLVASTFLVAPLSTKRMERIYPFQLLVVKSELNGLHQDSKVKLDQMRIIDKKRFTKKLGSLESDYHPSLFQVIDVMIDRFGDFR